MIRKNEIKRKALLILLIFLTCSGCGQEMENSEYTAAGLIPMHHNRGKTLARCLKERTDYAQNPEKSTEGELVTAYECDPMTCFSEISRIRPG